MSDVIIPIQPIALTREEAAAFVGLAVSTLEKLGREGKFPKPRQVSARRVVYLVRELVEWLDACPVSELLPPPNTWAPKPKRKE